mgnify:CR=1 FL=1
MSFNRHLFSSLRGDWRTPKALYQALDAEFRFTGDSAPSKPSVDGLNTDWPERTFCNAPYGRNIGKWVQKGYEESQKGKLVVMLLPSRTDTSWWHSWVMQAQDIRFIKGRLHFDERGPAPFPSCIVVFDDYLRLAIERNRQGALPL